jgi:hypothetical protein
VIFERKRLVRNAEFLSDRLLDFGDAPDTYGTLLVSNGAYHVIVTEPPIHMGPTVDPEPDGQPSPLADGDDLNPVGGPDDEDGVTLPPVLTPGDPAATVTVDGGPSGGLLDAWIDFDANGVFDHPVEHLWGGVSQPLVPTPAPNDLPFLVPADAVTGLTYARFRLSTAGGLPPTGYAPDGEVEDYLVEIEYLPGTIIVEKQTDPEGAPDMFTFTGDAAGTISHGQQIVVDGLQPGTYTSQEIVPARWDLVAIECDDDNSEGNLETQTATFQLEAGETVICTFTNEPQLDYGDAPDSYGTLLVSDGARHVIVTEPPIHMGPIVDAEPDGQPSPLADGDDLNGVPDDEDGVTLPPVLTPGDPAALVSVDGGPSGGMLDAWIDFDANGVFDHPGEQVFASVPLGPGPNPPLSFPVPAGATPGFTYARFRLSMMGGLPPTGFAPDGEVEDYLVEIEYLPGTIIVEKQTDPDGAPDMFTFTGDAAGTISDGEWIEVEGLQPGIYTSQETLPEDWDLVAIECDDDNSSGDLETRTATFQLEAGETVVCTFHNYLPLDYGDAPDSYGTLLASDGARHIVTEPPIYMGPLVDPEPDGQPSPGADGDDLDLMYPSMGDDEDGVTLPPVLTPGVMANVTVDGGPSGGLLDAWIDFDTNGVFDHPGEQIFVSVPLVPGPNPLSFPVPAGATPGLTYARFRLSINGGLPPTGFAPDGEVEDYLVEIEYLPGTIIVEKQTVPDGAPDDFTFSGDAAGTISDDGQIVVSGLQPGTYTSQETVPAGWDLTRCPQAGT